MGHATRPGDSQLPGGAASLVASCFGYFSLRYCHCDTSLILQRPGFPALFILYLFSKSFARTARRGSVSFLQEQGPRFRSAPHRGHSPLQSSEHRVFVSIPRIKASAGQLALHPPARPPAGQSRRCPHSEVLPPERSCRKPPCPEGIPCPQRSHTASRVRTWPSVPDCRSSARVPHRALHNATGRLMGYRPAKFHVGRDPVANRNVRCLPGVCRMGFTSMSISYLAMTRLVL